MSDLQEFWNTFNRIASKFSEGGIGLNPRLYTISRARQVYESEGKELTAEHLLTALDEDSQGVEITIEEAEMLIKTYLTNPEQNKTRLTEVPENLRSSEASRARRLYGTGLTR